MKQIHGIENFSVTCSDLGIKKKMVKKLELALAWVLVQIFIKYKDKKFLIKVFQEYDHDAIWKMSSYLKWNRQQERWEGAADEEPPEFISWDKLEDLFNDWKAFKALSSDKGEMMDIGVSSIVKYIPNCQIPKKLNKRREVLGLHPLR